MIRRVLRILIIFCLFPLAVYGQEKPTASNVTPKEVQLSGAGRYAEVVALLETQDRAALPVMSLTCLCGAYFELKRFRELPSCLDALDAKLAAGDRNYYTLDLSAVPEIMRGHTALELGRHKAALEHARRAETIVQTRNIVLYFKIEALALAGLAAAVNGETEEALDRARRLAALALGPTEELLQPGRAAGLARIYVSLGRYRDALTALHWTPGPITKLAKQLVGDSILLYQEIPYDYIRAKSLLETGKIAEAKTACDRLLKAPSIADFGSLYRVLLFDRGRIAEMQGKRDEAIDFYKRSIQEIEKQRSNLDAEIDKIGFVGDKLAVYAALVKKLIDANRPEQALEYAERAKSRALVDLLAQQRDFAPRAPRAGGPAAQNDQQLQHLLDALHNAEGALLAPDPATAKKEQLRAVAVTLKQDIKQLDPEVASLVSVEAASAQEIRALLAADETLLEFFQGGSDLFVFTASRDAVKARRIDLGVRDLGREVAALRRAIASYDSQAFFAPAQALYATLLGPAPEALARPKLLIAPHGPLHYLPFAALHDGRAFLADKAALRVLPSATVLRYLAGRERSVITDAPALILAAPDLGDPSLDLPGAAREAESIGHVLKNATLFLRGQATRAALRAHSGQASLLHLAAHGVFDPQRPLESGVLLTPAPGDDGRLRASDLYSMRIAARLVTLSACETGLGAAGAGDDVIGLTRGFLFAGAAGVLASLWQVSDEATAELMSAFYRNLETLAPAAALQKAALETRGRWPHPFYWAAFQLVGGW